MSGFENRIQQKNKENSSGRIRINDDIVFWDYEEKTILKLNIENILIIGEYTNSDGPWFDDWFLTFVTKDGQWQNIPMYAENITELLDFLSTKFNTDLKQYFLANSTDWDSVILYPMGLKGKKLFKLTPSDTFKVPKTLLDKLLFSIGLGKFDFTKYIELTEEVKLQVNSIG